MTTEISSLDMKAELFIKDFVPVRDIPVRQSEADLLKVLAGDAPPKAKAAAMIRLTLLTRPPRAANGGRFTPELATRLICQLETQRGTPSEEDAANCLLCEGVECEEYGDFDGAFLLYEAAAGLESKDPKKRYYSYNNTGFCLNFLKRFEEAAGWLERAIEHEERAYNAWKNLGVSLELSGKPEEAAKAYMQAINRSGCEARSLKHLLRLVERNPGLRGEEFVRFYLESLRRHGKI